MEKFIPKQARDSVAHLNGELGEGATIADMEQAAPYPHPSERYLLAEVCEASLGLSFLV
jgi:hypothetical protein